MSKLNKKSGTYKEISSPTEAFHAFIPNPLPPIEDFDLLKNLTLLGEANTALGRLDGMSSILPDESLFLYMYVRKEAVLSSQIEGTQSSLSDLLAFENSNAPGVPIDDVTEVSNYVDAMKHGLKSLEKLPISMRLLKEVHQHLLKDSRGKDLSPGEIRRTQNWIGGTRPGNAAFVPPPVDKIGDCLTDLEKFLHNEELKIPLLIKAALAHVQFETIHPFLDGNGRLGRLLITLILCEAKAMEKPLLYLSLYFKRHRKRYYELLQAVRDDSAWDEWIEFFLEGVRDTANQASETARNILALFKKDREALELSESSTMSVVSVFNAFKQRPLMSTKNITELCSISLPTALRSLNVLEEMGIVVEISGKERNKEFVYREYLNILNKEL